VSSHTYIFGWINFIILFGALLWLLRPAAHHFFYARRTRIRKQMVASVLALRQARARFARSQAAYERLPEDLEARKQAIEGHACEECRQIEAEAEHRSRHMLETAARVIKEGRAKAFAEARAEALTKAFAIARERLAAGASPERQAKWLDGGLQELEALGHEQARAAEER
jgi:F0F1-type ATP synthase membrane subunit b/b'